jgi:hypothetical protein
MKCPNCSKSSIAEIFWGYPADMDSMKEELNKKEIVLGGCLVSGHDAKWECNDCAHRWGDAKHNDELDNIDSFDYDQGFNINEVYDQ